MFSLELVVNLTRCFQKRDNCNKTRKTWNRRITWFPNVTTYIHCSRKSIEAIKHNQITLAQPYDSFIVCIITIAFFHETRVHNNVHVFYSTYREIKTKTFFRRKYIIVSCRWVPINSFLILRSWTVRVFLNDIIYFGLSDVHGDFEDLGGRVNIVFNVYLSRTLTVHVTIVVLVKRQFLVAMPVVSVYRKIERKMFFLY